MLPTGRAVDRITSSGHSIRREGPLSSFAPIPARTVRALAALLAAAVWLAPARAHAVADIPERPVVRQFPEGWCPFPTGIRFTASATTMKLTFTVVKPGASTPDFGIDNIVVVPANVYTSPAFHGRATSASLCAAGDSCFLFDRPGTGAILNLFSSNPTATWDLTHGVAWVSTATAPEHPDTGVVLAKAGYLRFTYLGPGNVALDTARTSMTLTGLVPCQDYVVDGWTWLSGGGTLPTLLVGGAPPAAAVSNVIAAPAVSAKSRVDWPIVPNAAAEACPSCGTMGNFDVASDGSGGEYIAFQDDVANPRVLVQHLGADGQRKFPAPGVEVAVGATGLQSPRVISDGAGGAIVAWHTDFSGTPKLSLQRIDSTGARLWGSAGVAAAPSSTGAQSAPLLVPDGAGGVIVDWEDNSPGSNNQFAQRLNAAGVRQWAATGVAVAPPSGAPAPQLNAVAAAGSAGSVLIAWEDYSGTVQARVQKLNSAGVRQWATTGVVLRTTSADQTRLRILHDTAGGAIVAWEELSATSRDLFIQRVGTAGNVAWVASGVTLCNAAGTQQGVRLTSDGGTGCVATWDDQRAGLTWAVYGQRLNASGVALWGTNGRSLSGSTQGVGACPVPDGSGGTYVLIQAGTPSGSTGIFSQRIDAAGAARAGSNLTIDTRASGALKILGFLDPRGGVVTTWGVPGATADIFAARIDSLQLLGTPSPWIRRVSDVDLDQGGRTRIEWDKSVLDRTGATGIEYQVLDRNGVPIGTLPATNASTYTFDAVSEADSFYAGALTPRSLYRVALHRTGPNDLFASRPDSGYSVDNLSPVPPQNGTAYFSPSFTTTFVRWRAAGPDVAQYKVYRGTVPDFVPSAGNFLLSTPDTQFVDNVAGEYVYKLSATDVHGNVGGFATITAGCQPQGTVDAPPARTSVLELAGARPNPARTSTHLAFALPRATGVDLRVYDLAGRLVRTLASGVHAEGRFDATWDLRDALGVPVPNGVYFARLIAGDDRRTRPVIVAR